MRGAFVAVGLGGALAATLLAPHLLAEPAKTPRHRVVFELTSGDPQAWDGVLNNVENVQKALGPSAIEVVVHGKALGMLTTAKSGPVRDRMKQLADGGVTFAACENTMRRQQVTKDQMVPFAKTVDSGLAQVIRRQEAGWSYVRSGP